MWPRRRWKNTDCTGVRISVPTAVPGLLRLLGAGNRFREYGGSVLGDWPPAGDPNEEENADVKTLVQHQLSQESTGRWLLVFDNADDIDLWFGKGDNAANSQRLVYDYLPRSGYGLIVFTTRSRKIAVKLAGTNIIEVKEMDSSVAKQVLSNSLVHQDLLADDKTVMKLLDRLTFLPIAIAQAAAYINVNNILLSDYLALLEQSVIELLSEDFEDEGRYREAKNPVTATWLITFEQMQRNNPLAAEYLSFMSCIDPRNIPQSLLPSAQSLKEEIDAIGTLSAYSLVSRRSVDESFDLHRLVYLATRNWLRMQNSLEEWTGKAIARLEEVLPENNPENRRKWRAYLPHAHYVLESDVAKDDFEKKMGLLWKSGSVFIAMENIKKQRGSLCKCWRGESGCWGRGIQTH
jgi:hypothetical protein